MKEKSHKSKEDYLETILMIKKKKVVCRGVDIANELGFKKSSVSVGIKHLKEDGMVYIDEQGFIQLTKEGLREANRVLDRHTTLTNVLSRIGVNKITAEKDACEIEHVISEDTYHRIKELYAVMD